MIDYEKYPVLFGLDSKGKVRTWQMERSGIKYRTISGLEDGKKAESGWTVATPKNLGKTNATTPEQQADLEVMAEYTKKRERKYYEHKDDLQNVQAGGHKFFAPMLAQTYESGKAFRTKLPWVLTQPKLDGVRAVTRQYGLFSRQGKPFPAVRHIHEIITSQMRLVADGTIIIDGELYNHALRDNFDEIVSLVKKQTPTPAELDKIKANIEYHVYDMFDTRNPEMSFQNRYEMLCHYTSHEMHHPVIKLVATHCSSSQDALDNIYAGFLSDGYEGQMIRAADSVYENKRSHSLLKRKEFRDDEFPILFIEEGEGNWAGYAKAIVCQLPDGRTFGSGLRGNQEFARELLHRNPMPKIATVRYQNLTPDGIPRFPVAVAFYDTESRDI